MGRVDVCDGFERIRRALSRRRDRRESGSHDCCAPGGAAAAKNLTDDEKKKHAKAGSWAPFTKFTPTDEGWKIERREATDAQKELKKNELKYVGTIIP